MLNNLLFLLNENNTDAFRYLFNFFAPSSVAMLSLTSKFFNASIKPQLGILSSCIVDNDQKLINFCNQLGIRYANKTYFHIGCYCDLDFIKQTSTANVYFFRPLKIDISQLKEIFIGACASNNIDAIMWINSNYCNIRDDMTLINRCVYNALLFGHYNVYEQLHTFCSDFVVKTFLKVCASLHAGEFCDLALLNYLVKKNDNLADCVINGYGYTKKETSHRIEFIKHCSNIGHFMHKTFSIGDYPFSVDRIMEIVSTGMNLVVHKSSANILFDKNNMGIINWKNKHQVNFVCKQLAMMYSDGDTSLKFIVKIEQFLKEEASINETFGSDTMKNISNVIKNAKKSIL